MEKICFAWLLVGLLAPIPTLLLAPFILFNDPNTRELLFVVIALGGGLAALLMGWFGATASRTWLLPKVLRRIGQKPFVLRSVESL